MLLYNQISATEELKMKVWNFGKLVDIEIGQRVLVAKCGLSRCRYGELAKLDRLEKKYMVFVTDSGAIVKTKIDNLCTVGKAEKAGYRVYLNTEEINNELFFKSNVLYWNKEKVCFENK